MQGKLNGIWIIANELEKPDIVIYYAHGSSTTPHMMCAA